MKKYGVLAKKTGILEEIYGCRSERSKKEECLGESVAFFLTRRGIYDIM